MAQTSIPPSVVVAAAGSGGCRGLQSGDRRAGIARVERRRGAPTIAGARERRQQRPGVARRRAAAHAAPRRAAARPRGSRRARRRPAGRAGRRSAPPPRAAAERPRRARSPRLARRPVQAARERLRRQPARVHGEHDQQLGLAAADRERQARQRDSPARSLPSARMSSTRARRCGACGRAAAHTMRAPSPMRLEHRPGYRRPALVSPSPALHAARPSQPRGVAASTRPSAATSALAPPPARRQAVDVARDAAARRGGARSVASCASAARAAAATERERVRVRGAERAGQVDHAEQLAGRGVVHRRRRARPAVQQPVEVLGREDLHGMVERERGADRVGADRRSRCTARRA